MAFASVGSFLSANDKSAGTTIVATASATVETGNLAAVWVGFDNEATTDGDSSQLSISDSAGNTWEKIYEKTETSGAADDGVCGALFVSVVTTDIASGSDTVTVTSTSSRTASAIHGYEFTVGAGVTVELADGTALALSQAASGQPGSLTVSSMTNEEHLLLYCYFVEGTQTITGYDTMTDAGANGTTGGAGDTNIRVEPAYAVATGTSFSVDATASSGAQWVQVLVALREVAGGQTVAISTATETDTASAVGRAKLRVLGVASSVESAVAVGRVKSRALGVAVDVGSALALTRAKSRSVGVAAESDVAVGVVRLKSRVAGVASEVDAALAFQAGISVPIGAAVETDSAVSVGRSKRGSIVSALETDLAVAVARAKRRSAATAYEADGFDQMPAVSPASGLWGGYIAKPAVTAGIADPDGGTGAYELASADGVSPPNWSGLFMSASNAGTTSPIGDVREIRVWLRAVTGTLAMTLAMDDSNTSVPITIDTTWREYRHVVTRTATGQGRIFQIYEQVAANTAWQMYLPRSYRLAAMPIGRLHSRAIAAAAETDQTVALARSKARQLGIGLETDTAMPLTSGPLEIVIGLYQPGTPAGRSGTGSPTADRYIHELAGNMNSGTPTGRTYAPSRPRKVTV